MAGILIGDRAVVIGAGMGGLVAARALADSFREVLVIERDNLPLASEHRTGTPQSRHVHALLAGGQHALDKLFPGFEEELAQAGAVPLRVGLDARIEMPGYDPFPQRDLGWHVYSMSRPLIELTVRRALHRRTNIAIRPRCRVLEITAASDGAAATGIRWAGPSGNSETIVADLIVDASGRGHPTLALLDVIGRDRPKETGIGVDIGYSTAVFAIPDEAPSDWKGLRIMPQTPASSRGGLMLPLEGNRWMVSLGGRYDEKPPGDPDGFLAFTRDLRTPTLYHAIRHAKPEGEPARYGLPASVWRHFERLDGFPRGLLPFGDAICRFNPIYGQGMSVAAQEALLLHRLLHDRADESDPLAGLAKAFFAEAQGLIETPWSLSAVPDFVFPQTLGERPADLDRRLQFGRALNRLAAEDADVHRQMLEVQHLLKKPNILREPELVRRVEAVMAAV
jgi:2-polyprenyl-6-methoxyphenol hydroxylase-like FAD-dependent oxidoreductase